MSVLIQIISVTTYSLSIAIVVLSRKRKYHLQDFASRGSLTLLWFLWTADTNYFHSIRMKLLPLMITIPLRIISSLLYVFEKIAISSENSQCSNNSWDMWKTLNSLIRWKKTSKDVTLNHNGSSISDPSVQGTRSEDLRRRANGGNKCKHTRAHDVTRDNLAKNSL